MSELSTSIQERSSYTSFSDVTKDIEGPDERFNNLKFAPGAVSFNVENEHCSFFVKKDQSVLAAEKKVIDKSVEQLTEKVNAVDKRVESATKNLEKAKEAGVDITKKTFLSKLGSLALSVGGLVAATAATVVTGGIATPFLLLALGNVAISAGDAYCAYQSAFNNISYPCGTDSVGNFIFKLQCRDSSTRSREQKFPWADGFSMALRGLCACTNPFILGASNQFMSVVGVRAEQGWNQFKTELDEVKLAQVERDLSQLPGEATTKLREQIIEVKKKIQEYREINDAVFEHKQNQFKEHRAKSTFLFG
ncbi:hypothetical protein JQC92_09000 [Shewanella sp. 202IG2-18]|uniref:hypothetical protein n=1 Tax=Parashewanella hymeniacidonis TaxID=2807618 RepID=UPI001960258B|nr:hypothetical protein [Parashewanella hymeniacidonis]MBM7072162.1 hypothetical protein [Parashewanella hymeniacidonis]